MKTRTKMTLREYFKSNQRNEFIVYSTQGQKIGNEILSEYLDYPISKNSSTYIELIRNYHDTITLVTDAVDENYIKILTNL